MNDTDSPHTKVLPYANVVYWKGNRAAGEKDGPDRCELYPAHGRWPSLDFQLPRQQYELSKVLQLMQVAYERGRKDNRAELGVLLRDLIAI